jgi:predicted aspartyl protease
MKPMRTLLACLSLCVAFTLPAQELKKPKDEFPESGMATFRLRIKAIPTLRMLINGVPVLMGVDTGCQGTAVLTPRAAARCGVTEAFSVPTMGNSGRSESSYGLVEQLQAGEVTWRDFHVALMPLDGMEIDGLLGADILFARPFYMDLSNKVMILGKIPDTSGAHEVPIYSRGGHCGVNIEVEGVKIPMIIDSGASKSYMSSLKFRGETEFRGYLPVATVRSNGLTRVEVCKIKSLKIGGAPLTGVEFIRDQEHNLLGDDFLRAHPIAVDMASRRLWLFEPQVAAKASDEPSK